ncbi:hypothetical protein V8B97DRAFT_1987840 [Scleroderma yunnanense]
MCTCASECRACGPAGTGCTCAKNKCDCTGCENKTHTKEVPIFSRWISRCVNCHLQCECGGAGSNCECTSKGQACECK